MELLWITLIAVSGPLLGTLLGSFLKPNDKFLSGSFAFTAGVMFAISFFELIPESIKGTGVFTATIAFIGGFMLMLIVDFLVPHFHTITDDSECSFERTSATIYTGVMMHNLPEGFAVGAGFTLDVRLGLFIAIAIALHDIPETLVPVASRYRVKKDRRTAIFTGFTVLFSTLLGIFSGAFLLKGISNAVIAGVLGVAAGIMVYLAGDELLPTAYKWGHVHLANFSLAIGIAFIMILEYAVGI